METTQLIPEEANYRAMADELIEMIESIESFSQYKLKLRCEFRKEKAPEQKTLIAIPENELAQPLIDAYVAEIMIDSEPIHTRKIVVKDGQLQLARYLVVSYLYRDILNQGIYLMFNLFNEQQKQLMEIGRRIAMEGKKTKMGVA